jgi:sugar-specific transcriptional regulator TrmB
MEKKEILEALKNLGLNEYEARAYSTLALLGPCKAGDVSKNANIPQSKIYDTLEELMRKQLVEVFEGRPKEFKAISPEVALRNLVEERERELESIKTTAKIVSSFLKPVAKEDILEGVWVQKGEKFFQVMNRLAEMLERARNYAYDITRDFSYSSRFREAIKGCIRKKVKLRVIGIGAIDEKNYYRAKWYAVHGIPLRIFETRVHPRILVVDGREVALRLDHNPLKDKFTFHSIWSEDPSLVKVFDTYVKSLWKIAKPVNFKKIPVPKAIAE